MAIFFKGGGGGLLLEGFCVTKWVGADTKSSLKQLTLTVNRLTFGRAYYRKDICVNMQQLQQRLPFTNWTLQSQPTLL